MVRSILIVLLLCYSAQLSCSPERTDWRKAQSEGSISGYEAYLTQYPQGQFADEAKSSIETIHFTDAEAANTIEAYEDYLERYSQGQFAERAHSQIHAISLEKAKTSDEIGDYVEFLNLYPNSPLASEAEQLLAKKGTILGLVREQLVLLEGLSEGGPDLCWLEFRGCLAAESKDEEGAGEFGLWHKREGFSDDITAVDFITGRVGEVLGGKWKFQLLRKGQTLGVTVYDEYGRPKEATRMPIDTVSFEVMFSLISVSDSEAKVLVLPESRIVATTE